jgi:hypothetical protein
MSHVVKLEVPEKWADLDGLSSDLYDRVASARATAINIIERLEPEHISSLADLIAKLEYSLENARMKQRIEKTVSRLNREAETSAFADPKHFSRDGS